MGRGSQSIERAQSAPRIQSHTATAARDERAIAAIGYTDHRAGMYSDKFIHKNAQTEGGRYITVGDPYKKTNKLDVPDRWKAKQFEAPQFPQNAGDGYFGYGGKPFMYQPDHYTEQLPYNKTQPPEKRKLGFGTHDAFKADEFTQRIRTEQYRDLLRREKRLMVAQDAKAKDAMASIVKAREAEDAARPFVSGKVEIEHLYDVGRNLHTAHNPRVPRDQFYTMDEAQRKPLAEPRRLGQYRTMSMDIGEGHWAVKLEPPSHGQNHVMANTFYDRSHLRSEQG